MWIGFEVPTPQDLQGKGVFMMPGDPRLWDSAHAP
jgi:hypothetical protein